MNRLGIDFGKVIMCPLVDGVSDTRFLGTTLEAAMETPAGPGAIDAVKKLVNVFEGEVWIVSKCGPSVQKKTRAWLDHHDFYSQTGLQKGNLRFCLGRADKAPICRSLAINHFIDDRVDVLRPMQGVVDKLFLFGEQSQRPPTWATHVADWKEVLKAFGLETEAETQCTAEAPNR